jgi:hypothetical protein
VHPYTYLVDVLQRVSEHPAEQVEQLTPRSSRVRVFGSCFAHDCVPSSSRYRFKIRWDGRLVATLPK